MVDNNDGDDHGHNKFLMKVGGDHASTSMGSHDHEGYCIKEQDRLLPIANVGRIMKQTLPTNAKISKEAKETMQECVSEFIGFVTGEASDKCHKEKRKTINGDDICWAMGTLGFDNYVEPLKRYLHKYRELEGERANQNKANNGDQSSSIIYESAQATKNQSSSSSAVAPFKFDFINEKSNSSMSSRPY